MTLGARRSLSARRNNKGHTLLNRQEEEEEGRDFFEGISLSRRARRQGRGRDALAAVGGLRSLTAARAVIGPKRAIPPKNISRDPSWIIFHVFQCSHTATRSA